MYNYPHYKENDRANLLAFMQQYPFITLIGADPDGRVEATQVPVLIEEREDKIFVTGHIARKSSHHKALLENPQALLIFTGPHAYVSGSWYSGNPMQASTWNYISVHARGTIRWTEEAEMIGILKKLSLHFEQGNTASSTIYDNLPAEYLEKLVKAIIGFEVEVTELDNVLKLSQNRDEKSYDNIISELKKQEGDARVIGDLMEKRKSKVFPS
ncbi:MAG: FMN-binding negative transcriptional regulator [Sphingobacteriales bacterium]|nr:FMN-binding negative transcriptional regulator [Sphingobacteriales bacterium]